MEKILDDVCRDAIAEQQMAEEDGTLLIDAAIHIVELSDVVRWEGLLALEEFMEGNESGFAKWLVMLVVDGTDSDLLCEMAVNEYWMRASKGIYAMVDYIHLRGMLCVQEGLNGKILTDFLQTLIPLKLRPEYREKLLEHQDKQNAMKEKREKENIEKFASIYPVFHSKEVIEKIHVLENKVGEFPNRTIQRVVRDLDNYCAEICIYAMGKEARKKVLENMSSRLAVLVIEDIVHFDSIEEQEVLKYIEKTLSIINKLTEMGEIYESDEE